MPRKGRVPGHVARRVEAEFDQPFWEVVAGFARDGESLNGTALILGYCNPDGLRTLVQRHNQGHLFHAKKHDCNGWKSAMVGTPRTAAQRAAGRATMDRNNAERNKSLTFEFEGFTGTLKDHALNRGLVYNTVWTRRKRGMSLEKALFRGSYAPAGDRWGQSD